jgi:hypothetical protein
MICRITSPVPGSGKDEQCYHVTYRGLLINTSRSTTLANSWIEGVKESTDKAQWKPWGDVNDGLMSSIFCVTYTRDIGPIVDDLCKRMAAKMKLVRLLK